MYLGCPTTYSLLTSFLPYHLEAVSLNRHSVPLIPQTTFTLSQPTPIALTPDLTLPGPRVTLTTVVCDLCPSYLYLG